MISADTTFAGMCEVIGARVILSNIENDESVYGISQNGIYEVCVKTLKATPGIEALRVLSTGIN